MTLFEECIEALGSNIVMLSDKQTHGYFEQLSGKFPITSWARIDWDKICNKKIINEIDDLNNWFNENKISSLDVNILWNNAGIPGVKTNLQNALQVLDDVLAVAPDTFMYNIEEGYVIEFYHDGEITVGLNNF